MATLQDETQRSDRVTLVVSIDTEEDNWTPTREGVTVGNLHRLEAFHERLRQMGVRPTYFVAYQVAKNPWAADILRALAATGEAELGAHLHPWNTPPLQESETDRNTMLKNLPIALQRAKLEHLTSHHAEVFGAPPISFRAGRFGIGPELIGPLVDLGYRVDSSVTPYWDWRSDDDGPDFSDAPTWPYRVAPGASGMGEQATCGPLVELPVSCGFGRTDFEASARLFRLFQKRIPRKLKLTGIAWRTGLLRRIFLSPELHDSSELLALSRSLMRRGGSYLHLMLHSSSLVPGLTPFTPGQADVDHLWRRTEEYVEHLRSLADVTASTVAECGADCGDHASQRRATTL